MAVLTGTMGATDVSAGAAPAELIAGARNPSRVAGRFLVVLDSTQAVPTAVGDAERGYGARVDQVYTSALHGYSARMSRANARALAQSPGVRFVEADIRFRVAAQSLPTGINRANAETNTTALIDHRDTRVNVDVAVIDTGVDLDHPDLNVFRAGATDCSTFGVGPDDLNGHGTHVAGTIGALDNRTGVVGMAPGARIWPVRVLNGAGSGTLSDVICGIDYVTAHANQIEVANMSLGAPGRDDGHCGNVNGDALHRAICASVHAGVTYVVAAGNSHQSAALSVPAAYDEVITVSALADFNGRGGGGARATCRPDVDDTMADFSDFGHDVDLIAPGVCIRSTWLGGGYRTISGTSMASPHVAGAAALFMATHPTATPGAVKAALRTAGSSRWNSVDDPDHVKEPLLNASGL